LGPCAGLNPSPFRPARGFFSLEDKTKQRGIFVFY